MLEHTSLYLVVFSLSSLRPVDSLATISDSTRSEVADVCRLIFGTVYTASNGGVYTAIGQGGTKFMLATLWSRHANACANRA